MTNHPPSVLWHCWLGHQTCKNRRPYNLYCVGADVKPCSINQLRPNETHVGWSTTTRSHAGQKLASFGPLSERYRCTYLPTLNEFSEKLYFGWGAAVADNSLNCLSSQESQTCALHIWTFIIKLKHCVVIESKVPAMFKSAYYLRMIFSIRLYAYKWT